MTFQARDWLLAAAAAAVLAAGLALAAVSVVGRSAGPGARAAGWAQLGQQVKLLAHGGRFDEAEARVDRYLKSTPGDARALVMKAELELNRPDRKPAQALEALGRIATTDRSLLAQVKLDQGKALYVLKRYDAAEAAWREAVRLNPAIGEAGWALLDLYYLQGRNRAARELGLRLHEAETDPRDRAQLLLELVRQDAQTIDAASLVERFGPVVAANPADVHTQIALGVALVRDHRPDAGLEILRRLIKEHPSDPDAWDGLLRGVGIASRNAEIAETVSQLPDELAGQPRFARYRGRVAWDQRRLEDAVKALRLAWEFDATDHESLYLLGRALRALGRTSEAEPLEQRARSFESAREAVRGLYNEANTTPGLGATPHVDLYHRLADLRERLGRPDEALAWHRLVLCDLPEDPTSQAAVKRLEGGLARRGLEQGHER